MGCDIHCHLEVEIFDDDGNPKESQYIGQLGYFCIGRNYEMFSELAGVRGWDEPLFEIRGFPGYASFELISHYYLAVVDEGCEYGEYRSVSREKINDYQPVKDLVHPFLARVQTEYVQDPDWHSCSYLYADELKAVCDKYRKEVSKEARYEMKEYIKDGEEPPKDLCLDGKDHTYIQLYSIYKMMKYREKEIPNQRVRMVFWFDS
jgi:hypothetical protein